MSRSSAIPASRPSPATAGKASSGTACPKARCRRSRSGWRASISPRSTAGDLEKSARFYQEVFDLKRVGQEKLDFAAAIYLSDGVVNLALLNYFGKRGSGLDDAKSFVGAHHFGFQVDDLAEAQERIEAAGGSFFFDLGHDAEKENFERKFKDPDGIIFDISRKGWLGAAG
jgi:predicted enzyme related to lactoylglutathione lyase